MFEKAGKNKKNEYVIGFDLTDSYAQVSVGMLEGDTVTTIPTTIDGSSLMIPTVMFKRAEVNQWFSGYEAQKHKDEEGYYLNRLVSKARLGENIPLGNDSVKPSALLALFIRRALTIANTYVTDGEVVAIMLTVDVCDEKMVQALEEVVASLSLKASVYFQSHMESFYNYMIYQPKELWDRDVLLLDGTNEYLRSLRMECNKYTTPIVAFIDPHESTTIQMSDANGKLPGSVITDFVEEAAGNRVLSTIYVIGDAFKGDWCKDSINSLCRRGRVFMGNNLFSKGAVYGAKNKLNPSILSSGYVFLGNDKLKSNVGMNVLKRGENVYFAILDAGINWFDAEMECEVILNQGNKVTFVITPLTGKNPKLVDITLNDLPKRPPKTSRLHMKVKMISETRMQVVIKDLGFGELFPASDTEWTEVISI